MRVAERAAADERHERRIAFLHAVPCEHDCDVRIRLDQLADAFEERRMVVLRLERRDHADDERFRTEVQLLADLAARGGSGLKRVASMPGGIVS